MTRLAVQLSPTLAIALLLALFLIIGVASAGCGTSAPAPTDAAIEKRSSAGGRLYPNDRTGCPGYRRAGFRLPRRGPGFHHAESRADGKFLAPGWSGGADYDRAGFCVRRWNPGPGCYRPGCCHPGYYHTWSRAEGLLRAVYRPRVTGHHRAGTLSPG